MKTNLNILTNGDWMMLGMMLGMLLFNMISTGEGLVSLLAWFSISVIKKVVVRTYKIQKVK